jgi:hypothetical protein
MSRAQKCREWSNVKQLGSLPVTQVREASGLCLSNAKMDRAFWTNDSGSKTRLYYGDLNGAELTAMDVVDFTAKDPEALLCARCAGGESCLILGDIGDNFRRRKSIQLAFFKDLLKPPKSIHPIRVLELTYPDGPHDAEAMFIGDDEDFFIVSKELRLVPPGASTAQVYRVPRKIWQDPGIRRAQLMHVGALAVPVWLKEQSFLGQAITDAGVDHRRRVLGLLTYGSLIEIPLSRMKNLKDTVTWQQDKDFFIVPIKPLMQQETVAYTADHRVIWSTEFFPPQAPIFSMTCRHSEP